MFSGGAPAPFWDCVEGLGAPWGCLGDPWAILAPLRVKMRKKHVRSPSPPPGWEHFVFVFLFLNIISWENVLLMFVLRWFVFAFGFGSVF